MTLDFSVVLQVLFPGCFQEQFITKSLSGYLLRTAHCTAYYETLLRIVTQLVNNFGDYF
jgi:hypothetical protein